MAKLRITYRKSAIGFSKDQKATVRSLGLRKLNSAVIQEDTPAIRGMIFKVQHLLGVEEVSGDVQPEQTAAPTTVVRSKEAHVSVGRSSQPSTTSTTDSNLSASESTTQIDTADSENVSE